MSVRRCIIGMMSATDGPGRRTGSPGHAVLLPCEARGSVILIASLLLPLAAAGIDRVFLEPPGVLRLIETPFHVGDEVVRRFRTPEPQGDRLVVPFDLTVEAARWLVTLETRHLAAPRADGEGSAMLVLDGVPVGTLNDGVTRESMTPRTSALALPGHLARGSHRLEVVPGVEASGGFDDFEVLTVALVPAASFHVVVRSDDGSPIWARLMVTGVDVPTPALGNVGGDDLPGAAIAGPQGVDLILPWGSYDLLATAGPEREIARCRLVSGSSPEAVDLTIARTIDTTGYIAGDLHLHCIASHDSHLPLRERITSCLAAGLELVVATDHNGVTDYGPTIRELGENARIASMVGDEITTNGPGFGHFNAFPLRPDGPPIPWQGGTPAELFRAARQAGDGDTILQVNHPRMPYCGYFESYHLDDSGRPTRRGFDEGFDAIEVLNGLASWEFQERALRDWTHLLDRGLRFTATGNSDSHRAVLHDAGYPRTYVRVETDDPAAADGPEIVRALRAGHAVVSTGPFVTIEGPDGAGPGDDVAAPGGRISVRVRVQAPAWIDVDTVEILGPGGRTLWEASVPRSDAALRFDERVDVELPEGGWVVALARGATYRAPVLARDLTPVGFTNPIFVRVAAAGAHSEPNRGITDPERPGSARSGPSRN